MGFRILMIFALSLLIRTELSAQIDTLLNTGATWKYFTGSFPGTNWDSLGFNDGSWASGPSQLGWGEGDEATVVPSGPSGNRYSGYYFRTTFNRAALPAFRMILIRLKRDDGIVLYVNGNEVWRDNMPAGVPGYATLASASASDDGQAWITLKFPPSLFATGSNLIAAEVHQNSITSSDISFELQVLGVENQAVLLVRGPYLQMATDTSMNLRWRSDTLSNSIVRYGLSPTNLNQIIQDTTQVMDHEMHIGGLNPGTRYYYSFGKTGQVLQGDTSNYFITAQPRGSQTATRIWVTGDCGTAQSTQTSVMNQFLNHIGNTYVNAWLLLGDNAYNAGLDSEYTTNFFQPYQESRIMKQTCIWPAPGNHDYANNGALLANRSLPYYQNFTVPVNGELGGAPSGTESFYSYDIANIHFISLDAYGTENNLKLYDTTGVQATWLKQDLAANTRPWTILYWHHPPYTKGSHNSDTETELINIRSKLLPILDRYKVDLILCGHSHCYERSKLMKGHYGLESTFSPGSHLGDSSSAQYNGTANSCPYVKDTLATSNEGIVYVVAGSAGKFGGTSTGYPHDAMFYSNPSNGGSLYLVVEGNRLDAKFISDIGVIEDRFSIFKNPEFTRTLTLNEGRQANLQAGWQGNYLWPSTGATTPSISVSPVHPNLFIVNDSLNCLTDSFFVTINDTIPPVLSGCPANQTLGNAFNQCGRNVVWTPPQVIETHLSSFGPNQASGSFFPVGSTQVNYTATDSSGNTTSCSFVITIQDTQPPSIICPASVSTNNDAGQCSAVITYSLNIKGDNCGAFSFTQTSGLGSGSAFPVGITTNTFRAIDTRGNSSTCSFSVTVSDTSPPALLCPASQIRACENGVCGAHVSFSPPLSTDNCSGAQVQQTSGSASGTFLNTGIHSFSFRVTDASGLTASCSFSVEIADSENPVLQCPASISVSTDSGSCEAIVHYPSFSSQDNCAIATDSMISGLASGSPFPRGITNLAFLSEDIHGNSASCTFSISVSDSAPPVIQCPADTLLYADPNTCLAVAIVNSPNASDNCALAAIQQNTGPLSGDSLAPGIYLANFEASDSALNTSTCQFRIEVLDTSIPVWANCPAQAIHFCDSEIVNFSAPIANDLCGNPQVSQVSGLPSGSIFPLGNNPVRFLADDGNGNSSECLFDVIIHANPLALFLNLPDSICLQSTPFTLQGDPAGGNFSGNGVTGSTFSPALSGIGNHSLSYAFTDSNGCSDTAIKNIHVRDCSVDNSAEPSTEFQVYPNPATLFIRIQPVDEVTRIELMSSTGTILPVNSEQNGDVLSLDLRGLSSGIYFIRIQRGNLQLSKKFILRN